MSDTKLNLGKSLNNILHGRYRYYIAPVAGSIMLMILGNILAPGFISLKSILSLLALSSILVCVCVSQQLITLEQGINLSVSGYMILGVAWGGALSNGSTLGLIKAIILMGAIGAVCGVIEGICVMKVGLPSMVVTLSMCRFVSQGYMAVTKGRPTGQMAPILKTIGMGSIFGIRWILIIAVIVTVLFSLFLSKTRAGKKIYLVGTNMHSAEIAGIPSTKVVVACYTVAAVWGTICGFLLLGMIGAMSPEMTNNYVMLSVCACVIGGAGAGRGDFVGPAFGAVFMTLMSNVLSLTSLPDGFRRAVQGAVLLLILCIYSRSPKLRK